MCLPVVFLTDLQIKRRKYFKEIVLNDVDKVHSSRNLPVLSGSIGMSCHEKKKTEFHFVSLVVYKGMQTYRVKLEFKGFLFEKHGPNCRELAVALDRKLIDKGYQPLVLKAKEGTLKLLKIA